MNEQPSKSGVRNQPSNTSKIASNRSRRIRRFALDLSLEPPPGPQLVATLEERQHEVLLGGEVAVHGLPGDARSLDDRVDPDRLNAPAREQLIGRLEQSLPRFAAAPFALSQKR